MMRQTAVGCRRPGRSHSFRSTSTETACCRPFARPRPPVRCRPRAPCRRVDSRRLTATDQFHERFMSARMEVEIPTVASRFVASFLPLRNRNLRVYLSGQVISLIGTWMQVTAQAWVVWSLSHSTTALGLVAMLGTLPILVLGPWTGVWADTLDRRRVLVATQMGAMVLAATLALLVQTGAIQVWHVYIFATLLGIVTALDMPAQQAFIGDLSGMEQVRQAVVINNMLFQVSRMLGPALAGLVVAQLGAAPAFWLNGVSFLAVIGSLLVVRSDQVRRSGAAGLGGFL